MEKLTYGSGYIRRSSPFVHGHRCDYVVSGDRKFVCYRASSVSPPSKKHTKAPAATVETAGWSDDSLDGSEYFDGDTFKYRSRTCREDVDENGTFRSPYDQALYGYDDPSPAYIQEAYGHSWSEKGIVEWPTMCQLDKVQPRSFADILNSGLGDQSREVSPEMRVTQTQDTISSTSDCQWDVLGEVIGARSTTELDYLKPRFGVDSCPAEPTGSDFPQFHDAKAEEKPLRSPVRSLFGAMRTLRRRMNTKSREQSQASQVSAVTTHSLGESLIFRLRSRSIGATKHEDGKKQHREYSNTSATTPTEQLEDSAADLLRGVVPRDSFSRRSTPKKDDQECPSPCFAIPQSILKKLVPDEENDNRKDTDGAVKPDPGSITHRKQDISQMELETEETDTFRDCVMPVDTDATNRLFIQRYQNRRRFQKYHLIREAHHAASSKTDADANRPQEGCRADVPLVQPLKPPHDFGVSNMLLTEKTSTKVKASNGGLVAGFANVARRSMHRGPKDEGADDTMPNNIELSRIISTFSMHSKEEEFLRHITTVINEIEDYDMGDGQSEDERQETGPTQHEPQFVTEELLSRCGSSLKSGTSAVLKRDPSSQMPHDDQSLLQDRSIKAPLSAQQRMRPKSKIGTVSQTMIHGRKSAVEPNQNVPLASPMMYDAAEAQTGRHTSRVVPHRSDGTHKRPSGHIFQKNASQYKSVSHDPPETIKLASHDYQILNITRDRWLDIPQIRVDVSKIESPLDIRLEKTMTKGDLLRNLQHCDSSTFMLDAEEDAFTPDACSSKAINKGAVHQPEVGEAPSDYVRSESHYDHDMAETVSEHTMVMTPSIHIQQSLKPSEHAELPTATLSSTVSDMAGLDDSPTNMSIAKILSLKTLMNTPDRTNTLFRGASVRQSLGGPMSMKSRPTDDAPSMGRSLLEPVGTSRSILSFESMNHHPAAEGSFAPSMAQDAVASEHDDMLSLPSGAAPENCSFGERLSMRSQLSLKEASTECLKLSSTKIATRSASSAMEGNDEPKIEGPQTALSQSRASISERTSSPRQHLSAKSISSARDSSRRSAIAKSVCTDVVSIHDENTTEALPAPDTLMPEPDDSNIMAMDTKKLLENEAQEKQLGGTPDMEPLEETTEESEIATTDHVEKMPSIERQGSRSVVRSQRSGSILECPSPTNEGAPQSERGMEPSELMQPDAAVEPEYVSRPTKVVDQESTQETLQDEDKIAEEQEPPTEQDLESAQELKQGDAHIDSKVASVTGEQPEHPKVESTLDAVTVEEPTTEQEKPMDPESVAEPEPMKTPEMQKVPTQETLQEEDKIADAPAPETVKKKKKSKTEKQHDGEKKKKKKKRRKGLDLADDRPRPLRHLIDNQLKDGFTATVYVVTSKKSATSSLCKVKFDYDADRLIFETTSNTFDIDASKVVAEEIPTLPGAPVLLKLTINGKNSSAVVIQSTDERNLNVLGGTVGWAPAAQKQRTEGVVMDLGTALAKEDADSSDISVDEPPRAYKRGTREVDNIFGQQSLVANDDRSASSKGSKMPVDMTDSHAVHDTANKEDASNKEQLKDNETKAGNESKKRGFLSRLLLRKHLSKNMDG